MTQHIKFTYETQDLLYLFRSRKMLPSDMDISFDEPVNLTLPDVKRICEGLSVPLFELLRLAKNCGDDLTCKVKIGRNSGYYERIATKNGVRSYHYRHVLKTSSDYHFMALRTTPLYEDEVYLNDGHATKELVYVLRGSVFMHWQKGLGAIRKVTLNQGDSVYIEPWVKHAFSKIEPDSEILAVDFL